MVQKAGEVVQKVGDVRVGPNEVLFWLKDGGLGRYSVFVIFLCLFSSSRGVAKRENDQNCIGASSHGTAWDRLNLGLNSS